MDRVFQTLSPFFLTLRSALIVSRLPSRSVAVQYRKYLLTCLCLCKIYPSVIFFLFVYLCMSLYSQRRRECSIIVFFVLLANAGFDIIRKCNHTHTIGVEPLFFSFYSGGVLWLWSEYKHWISNICVSRIVWVPRRLVWVSSLQFQFCNLICIPSAENETFEVMCFLYLYF